MSVAVAPRPRLIGDPPERTREREVCRLAFVRRIDGTAGRESVRRNETSEVLHSDVGAVRVAVRARARGRHTCRHFDFEPGECDPNLYFSPFYSL